MQLSQQEMTMFKHETLTDAQLELASGGEKTAPPPPPPQTCVRVCEAVKGSDIVVCAPMICF
jgi:hypothetical protein